MKKLTIPVMLTLVLCNSSSALPAPSDASDEDQTRQLEAVKIDIRRLEKTLKAIRKERSSLESALQVNEKTIDSLHREIHAIEQQLQEGHSSLKKFSSQRQALVKEKNAGLQAMTVSLRSVYMAGQDSPFKLLLNLEDPGAIIRILTYQRYFSDAQRSVIHDLRNTIDRLTVLENSIATTNRQLEASYNQLINRRNRLTTRSKERQQLLARLKQEEGGKNRQLNTLEQQQKELEQLIAAILDLKAPAGFDRPFIKARGKLPWPVKGRVTHWFGQRRVDDAAPWNGLFIQVAQGTTVKAPWHGQVIFADWLKGFGLLMILNHGNDYMTLYAHNQTLLRNIGDWVSAGDDIAETGATGGNNDTGLYFELRKNGEPVDPSPWLAH